jgi:hypothetical protein
VLAQKNYVIDNIAAKLDELVHNIYTPVDLTTLLESSCILKILEVCQIASTINAANGVRSSLPDINSLLSSGDDRYDCLNCIRDFTTRLGSEHKTFLSRKVCLHMQTEVSVLRSFSPDATCVGPRSVLSSSLYGTAFLGPSTAL